MFKKRRKFIQDSAYQMRGVKLLNPTLTTFVKFSIGLIQCLHILELLDGSTCSLKNISAVLKNILKRTEKGSYQFDCCARVNMCVYVLVCVRRKISAQQIIFFKDLL